MGQIRVTLRKSLIGQKETNCKVVKALGLSRINSSKVQKDNNCTRGMINKVKHLIEYDLISE